MCSKGLDTQERGWDIEERAWDVAEWLKKAHEGDTINWLCYKGILDKGEEEDTGQWGRKGNYYG